MFATCVTLPADPAVHAAVEDLITETPAGLIAHVAGPVEGGWRIIDVWETQADQQRFAVEVLRPAIAKVAGEDALSGPSEQLFVLGTHERRGAALAAL